MVVVPEPKNVDKICIANNMEKDEMDAMSYVDKVEKQMEEIKAELHKQLVTAIKASKEVKAFEKPH